MTSIERTAYLRFKRLITAHELHLFFSPTREEAAWAAERMDADGHQLALLLALKSYQRMGRFPKPDEYPEMVIDFVRRAVELPEGTTSLWATGRTAERQRMEVRRRVGATYDQARARRIAEESIRKEAHKARMRVRDDLATMFCKRVATKIEKARAELEEIRLAEREIVEALIENYRTVLKHLDEGGPAQETLEKAAAMTAQARQALDGLDEQAPVDEVVGRLEGRISPAVLALAKALGVQAGGVGAGKFSASASRWPPVPRRRAPDASVKRLVPKRP